MGCPDANVLGRMVDGGLADAERTDLETHLDECATCARVVFDLGGLVTYANAPSRYTYQGEIARGGMGRVVEAVDTLLGRTVACKEVLATDDDSRRRFLRETRITARLEHPSIVPIYDAGTTPDGSPFYVMRKVSGRPLDELIARAHSLNARLALLPYMVSAVQAIAHAHQRGVIHRDLKPSNILVGDLGETVVIDWGLAKVIGEPDDDDPTATVTDAGGSLRTRIGSVMGTPGFMAPEQLRGDPADPRSDVYALGATLYYLFAGRVLYTSTAVDDLLDDPPKPIATVTPELPAEVATIINKALAFDEGDRYPNAGALAEDLTRFLTGRLVVAHTYSRRDRFVRFARKHRLPVAIAAIASTLLIVGSTIAIRSVVAERDRADAEARLATTRGNEAEASRRREQERGDQLLLDKASALVATDPTAAAALLKQLTTPPDRWQHLWRSVRDVVASARTAGVAWGVPGLENPVKVRMSPNGKRAIVFDVTGAIDLYELGEHTRRTLKTGHPWTSALFGDDDHLLVYDSKSLTEIDIRSEDQTSLATAGFDGYAAASDGVVYWVEEAKQIWRRAPGRPAVRLPLSANTIRYLWPSPDGRWLLAITQHELALYDGEAPTRAPRILQDYSTVAVPAWTDDSTTIYLAVDGRIGAFHVDGTPPTWRGSIAPPVMTIRSVRGAIYALTGQGLYSARSSAQSFAPVRNEIRIFDSLEATFGDCVAIGSTDGVYIDGEATLKLRAPTTTIISVASQANSPYVVAATPGRVMIWDLAAIIPTRQDSRDVQTYAALGSTLLIAHGARGGTVERVDTRRGTITPVTGLTDVTGWRVFGNPRGGPLLVQNAFPSGWFVIDAASGRARRLDIDVTMGMVADDGTVIVADADGSVFALDTAFNRTTLFDRPADLTSFAIHGHFVLARYADGLVRRRDLVSGNETTLQLKPSELVALYLTADGRVVIGDQRELVSWSPQGAHTVWATMPGMISAIAAVGANVLVTTEDGTGYLVELEGARRVTSQIPPGILDVGIANDVGLALLLTSTDRLDLLDLTTGVRWPVVDTAVLPRSEPTISADGQTVRWLSDGRLVHADLALPMTAEATSTWLSQLTNATSELGTSALTWAK